jgi:hypothetical protein
MEITLKNSVYAINPRRIITIEKRGQGSRPVIIHMTEGFQIMIGGEDEAEDDFVYERLRDELASIVGG